MKSKNSIHKKDKIKKENNEIPGEGDILVADEVDLLPVEGNDNRVKAWKFTSTRNYAETNVSNMQLCDFCQSAYLIMSFPCISRI